MGIVVPAQFDSSTAVTLGSIKYVMESATEETSHKSRIWVKGKKMIWIGGGDRGSKFLKIAALAFDVKYKILEINLDTKKVGWGWIQKWNDAPELDTKW